MCCIMSSIPGSIPMPIIECLCAVDLTLFTRLCIVDYYIHIVLYIVATEYDSWTEKRESELLRQNFVSA